MASLIALQPAMASRYRNTNTHKWLVLRETLVLIQMACPLFILYVFHPYSTVRSKRICRACDGICLINNNRSICKLAFSVSFTEIFSRMAVKISCLKYAKHVSHTVCVSHAAIFTCYQFPFVDHMTMRDT